MYEYVKTDCKHIQHIEQPLQFQSGYYLNKPRMEYNFKGLKWKEPTFVVIQEINQLNAQNLVL